jgi:type II secretory pathway pseudopilin PulG
MLNYYGFNLRGKEMDVKCLIVKSHRHRDGIVLVETLVALTIFAVFITGASRLLMHHRQMSDSARANYTAINIAKNRMELIRTFQFTELNSFVENQTVVDEGGFPDAANGQYRRTTSFRTVNTNLLEMAITVEIRNRKTLRFDGAQQQLTTFLSHYLTEESTPGGGLPSGS